MVRTKVERNLAVGGVLERISLSDGKRLRVAKLPPFACAGQSSDGSDAEATAFPDLGLAIQAPGDFVVDKSGALACLTLMDRNLNMASVLVGVQVDLKIMVPKACLSAMGLQGNPEARQNVEFGKPRGGCGCGQLDAFWSGPEVAAGLEPQGPVAQVALSS